MKMVTTQHRKEKPASILKRGTTGPSSLASKRTRKVLFVGAGEDDDERKFRKPVKRIKRKCRADEEDGDFCEFNEETSEEEADCEPLKRKCMVNGKKNGGEVRECARNGQKQMDKIHVKVPFSERFGSKGNVNYNQEVPFLLQPFEGYCFTIREQRLLHDIFTSPRHAVQNWRHIATDFHNHDRLSSIELRAQWEHRYLHVHELQGDSAAPTQCLSADKLALIDTLVMRHGDDWDAVERAFNAVYKLSTAVLRTRWEECVRQNGGVKEWIWVDEQRGVWDEESGEMERGPHEPPVRASKQPGLRDATPENRVLDHAAHEQSPIHPAPEQSVDTTMPVSRMPTASPLQNFRSKLCRIEEQQGLADSNDPFCALKTYLYPCTGSVGSVANSRDVDILKPSAASREAQEDDLMDCASVVDLTTDDYGPDMLPAELLRGMLVVDLTAN
ncbi:hypothetical protein DFJ77DRAFT_442050 [Powellomyces hirtus]|nr:hypothetical protein DFJ77DRAFT_442050 [Powellomyces hirtus]